MTVRKELLNNIRIVDPYVPGEQPRQKGSETEYK